MSLAFVTDATIHIANWDTRPLISRQEVPLGVRDSLLFEEHHDHQGNYETEMRIPILMLVQSIISDNQKLFLLKSRQRQV